MIREIALDTETTGLDPAAGHRIVEIACLELVNHVPTGQGYQSYFNPERAMDAAAFDVHGLSEEFLSSQPLFVDQAERLLAFIAESPLVIHNAEFDLGFLNAELERVDRPRLDVGRAIDTVRLARRKFPGAPASLDALCRRFGIDNSARTKHGALLDAELLSEVYLELIGGRQTGLDLTGVTPGVDADGVPADPRKSRVPRGHAPSEAELSRHEALVGSLKNPIWLLDR
jgi:DNA polymerase-3 subunit epsilon